ncbi:Aldo/keto reductase [Mycena albidolilacea]|uniref:Aldo/keto reductase n=1 Tax=Mycena albidolilacea TaxID=1033008 RepID=A0AAD6ZMN4_9AGAR|nr:Aldo/keto reductase [Mycena albidolilacea]
MATIPTQKSALNIDIVMDAMTFGAEGADGARVHETKDIEAILDVFLKHGDREIFVTSSTPRRGACIRRRNRRGGFGQDQLEKGILMETKLYPVANWPYLEPRGATITGTHSPEDLRKFLKLSLKELNRHHSKAIDELYREGHFKRFGISNYMAWEVAEIVGICKQHGYVPPTLGITFYEFNPLAGGFFTDRYTSIDEKPTDGSRFGEGNQGKNYRKRYWKPAYSDALASIRTVVQAHGMTMAEVALRWISHHLLLRREHAHIEQNLVDLEKGPLHEVVEALDAAWESVKSDASNYYH